MNENNSITDNEGYEISIGGSKNMTKENIDLKIGMYLESAELKCTDDEFDFLMENVPDSDFDILVFPEFSGVPFVDEILEEDITDEDVLNRFYEDCLIFSKMMNKAVIINTFDKNECIFSVYANYYATGDETSIGLYIKHTMTSKSAFDMPDYADNIPQYFTPIRIKDYTLGMTICYDCNHAPFSRMYGLQDVDLIVNSTGGDVQYAKWYTYNKTRAIENNCFNFVTMGGQKPNKNFTYGFNPEGGLINPVNINDEKRPSTPETIYIYDLSSCKLEADEDEFINQRKSFNKYKDVNIEVGNTGELVGKAKQKDDDLYVYKVKGFNLVILIVHGNDIFKPEKVLPLLYSKKLSRFKNKKYLIINKHDGQIDEKFFEEKLSIILKTRTIENYCAVILESDNICKCYQSTSTRQVQLIKENDENIWSLDLKRMSGPDSIWRNREGMRKNWRENFENLIDCISNFSDFKPSDSVIDNIDIDDTSIINDTSDDTTENDEINSLEEYMNIIEEFYYDALTAESKELLKKNHGLGKIIYRIVLKNGEILNHQYVYAGTEIIDGDKFILGIPHKIPEKNLLNINDEDVRSTVLIFIPDDDEYLNLDD